MADEIAKFRFEWRDVEFTWTGREHFTGGKEGVWHAVVKPEGLAWDARLSLHGACMQGEGLTPQLALEAARQVWLDEVQKEFS